MSTATPKQTLWQWLNDPGVVPELDNILQVLKRIANNIDVQRITQPQGIASATGAASPKSGSLISLIPTGTVFTLPQTLQEFNELIGATAINGAIPDGVTLTKVIDPYSTGNLQYQVPSGKYALAMASFDTQWSYHSPGITVMDWFNYGLPTEVPLTAEPVPVLFDYSTNKVVTGSHEITDNITSIITNNTPKQVRVTTTTVYLIIDKSRWDSTYAPIFRQAVRAWIDALAADARAIGGAAQ